MAFWFFATFLVISSAGVILYTLASGRFLRQKQTISFADLNKELEKTSGQLGSLEICTDSKGGVANQVDNNSRKLSRCLLDLEVKKNDDLAVAVARQQRTTIEKIIIAFSILLLPIISFSGYFILGSPGFSGYQFSELLKKPPQLLTKEEKVVRLGVLFLRDPKNGRLADQLAASELEAGHYQDAVNTYVDALRINGDNAPRLVGYAIALTEFEGGIITDEALKAFTQAAKLAPSDFYPRVFIAASYAQSGQREKAAQYLEAFLENSAKDAPWRRHVEQLIKQYRSLSKSSGSGRSGADKLISNLTAKLARNADDVEAWQELIKLYQNSQGIERARAALDEGLSKLSKEKAQSLAGFARHLGLIARYPVNEVY